MNEITLVIPAKNEPESLPKVLDELNKYDVKKIIVMSKDDLSTYSSIKSYNEKILFQTGKGFGNALREGISSVETKYFCVFNADGSFDPSDLYKLKEKLESGSDFVFSSRYIKGAGTEDDTFLTSVGNFFFTQLCNFLFKLRISDVLYTYVMGSAEAFKSLDMRYDDFSFCVELPIKAKKKNFILTDFPSFERSRIAGVKKVNEFRDGFLILISILRLLIVKK
jgi:glycosyltransferase involved in cell wall biosynthesis